MTVPIIVEEKHAAFFEKMEEELNRLDAKGFRLRSIHEGAGLFLEEVDELWDEVKANNKKRDWKNFRLECLQCATLAMRMAIELEEPKKE